MKLIYVYLHAIVFLFSCNTVEKKEEKADASIVRDSIGEKEIHPPCDSNHINLIVIDSLGNRVSDALLAIFTKGSEEDYTSVFRDTRRTFRINEAGLLCLSRDTLYKKYFVSPKDTLTAAIYKKRIGYSYPFQIFLSEKSNVTHVKWGFSEDDRL